MAAESAVFVIATFALWAGDFEYFESRMRDFARSDEIRSREKHIETPEDLMRATAALRLRQLWQRRGEFKRLAQESTGRRTELSDRPTILETVHLRATVWRLND